MKKIQIKKRLLCCFLALLALPLYSFDWPGQLTMPDAFVSFFAQNRGNTFSPSLVFKGASPVFASDSGRVLIIIGKNKNSSAFFPSTLGNAMVIAHKDSLLSVYGSLNSESVLSSHAEVSAGKEIAITGTSGWNTLSESLEFQVVDTKNKALINPLVLMPSLTEAFDLKLGKIYMVDKKGSVSDLSTRKTAESGSYILYRDSSAGTMPYKTSLTVNGTLIQTITYDALFLYEQQLCINGKKALPYSLVYFNDSLQYLSEIHITRGKTVITVQAFDIQGNQKQLSFTLDVF